MLDFETVENAFAKHDQNIGIGLMEATPEFNTHYDLCITKGLSEDSFENIKQLAKNLADQHSVFISGYREEMHGLSVEEQNKMAAQYCFRFGNERR
jgi:hypothetical protein